ncbi:hypothetical protein MTP10_21045 [Nonomuraea sp. 3-1Str]|uniref:hypothetical protein n=1 Tax=Nonomuraea sp. 3-1Str TaxID=2929801 RepID=UPI00285A0302|nr:hypothetical protein [Nonomuraea sp. 3-1Str]MDR8411208.1 hypothetical protein [Nonomuraea sp. 3-1Str]
MFADADAQRGGEASFENRAAGGSQRPEVTSGRLTAPGVSAAPCTTTREEEPRAVRVAYTMR